MSGVELFAPATTGIPAEKAVGWRSRRQQPRYPPESQPGCLCRSGAVSGVELFAPAINGYPMEFLLRIYIGILMVAGANSSTTLTTALLQRPWPFYPNDIVLSMEN